MLRAIAFDMDGTLVDTRAAVRGALAVVIEELRRLTPAADGLTVEDLDAHVEEVIAELGPVSWNVLRRAGFARTLSTLGQPAEHVDLLSDLFFAHRFPLTRPYPDVAPALAELAGSYVVGVGSNGTSFAHRCGLDGAFHFEVYAHVDGVPPKPSPEFYAMVAAAAGAHPQEMAFVGDSIVDDVTAAQAAGMRAVWVNRDGRRLPAGVTPDAELTSLAGLPDALLTLHTRTGGAVARTGGAAAGRPPRHPMDRDSMWAARPSEPGGPPTTCAV